MDDMTRAPHHIHRGIFLQNSSFNRVPASHVHRGIVKTHANAAFPPDMVDGESFIHSWKDSFSARRDNKHISKKCVRTTPHSWSNKRTVMDGAIAPLIMHAVLVHREEKFWATLLSGNTSRKGGVSSSATAGGTLCCTSTAATLTSARVV